MKIPDFERLRDIVEAHITSLFDPTMEHTRRFLGPVWIVGMYLLGVYFWGSFFSWGRFPMNFEDWAIVTAPRLDAVRDGIQLGQLPLHISDTLSLHKYTDRFLTTPDVVTSPQMILLRFIDIDTFVVVDVLFEFTLATLGLLWIKRHFKLSLGSWSLLFLLFNFNGYIQAHYAIGHFSWGGYFMLPWFFALLIRLLEGAGGWRWVTQISLVLFYIVLTGSEHLFLWLLLLLALLAVVSRKEAAWILAAIVCGGLLSAARLLPPVLEISPLTTLSQTKIIMGYPSVSDLICWMTVFGRPNFGRCQGAGWAAWEYDLYVGFLGTVFIIYFGVIKGLFPRDGVPEAVGKLLIPAVLITLLTIGNWFGAFRATGIPFFDGERVISRMIVVPFFIFVLAGVLSFERWLKATVGAVHYLLLIGLTFLANDLWLHSLYWRPAAAAKEFPAVHLDLAGNGLSNHPDPIYFRTLAIGAAISILTFAFLVVKSYREYKTASVAAA